MSCGGHAAELDAEGTRDPEWAIMQAKRHAATGYTVSHDGEIQFRVRTISLSLQADQSTSLLVFHRQSLAG